MYMLAEAVNSVARQKCCDLNVLLREIKPTFKINTPHKKQDIVQIVNV